MTETYHVSLEGKEGTLPGPKQAEFLKSCLGGINYPAEVTPAKEGLKVTIYDPSSEYEDGMDELTDKLNEAGVLAYVEEC